MLAQRLIPYVQYPPAGRLTKFSGEPKYEPEARAETAMAYLLHQWRDRLAGDVRPVSAQEYLAHYSTAVDYGAGPGLLVHQSPSALAAAVTKLGFVKFAYHPEQDDWLFDEAGTSPAFLPSTTATVQARSAHAYTPLRDGFAGSAATVKTGTGTVGFTSLPDGSVVYATSGAATGWSPGGSGGRMVVDLGATRQIGEVGLTWTPGARPEVRVETSTDGETYTPLPEGGATARYVAIVVSRWRPGRAALADLSVLPAKATG